MAAPALAGCVFPFGGDDAGPAEQWWPTATSQAPGEPVRVTFGGRVVDALSGAPVPDAEVRLDLAHTLPCRQESIVWNAWPLAVDAEGAFGPFELPAPNSPTQRFFLHADAAGYTTRVQYVGPENVAEADNLTLVLHPRVSVDGAAPPHTVLALSDPEGGFPRFAVANGSGGYAFEDAGVYPARLVAATPVPFRVEVQPPAVVNATNGNGTGWSLQGVLKREDGSPIDAHVVAWRGDALWSAAVTDEVGRFLLPLAPEPGELRIEARTQDDHWGGALTRNVNGPPSTVETIVMRPLC